MGSLIFNVMLKVTLNGLMFLGAAEKKNQDGTTKTDGKGRKLYSVRAIQLETGTSVFVTVPHMPDLTPKDEFSIPEATVGAWNNHLWVKTEELVSSTSSASILNLGM